MLSVFVYGTLKPGCSNYQAYCGDRILSRQIAQVRGRLYRLPLGYPAMVAGDEWVKGYVLTFKNDAILAELDELEDYRSDRPAEANEYQRQRVEVFDENGRSLGVAWTYWMTLEKVEHLQGEWIATGEWP